jgi:hypothetical protein
MPDGGNVGIGITPIKPLHIHAGANQNILIGPQVSLAGAVAFQALTDSAGAYIPIEFNASHFGFYGGGITVLNLPNANPGGGSRQLWYDPADGNRVKFAA